MEFGDVVNGRRSARGFKPAPVPQSVLEEVVKGEGNHPAAAVSAERVTWVVGR